MNILLKILRIVLGGYILISSNYEVLTYLIFFMGAMLLVIGIAEIKMGQKNGYCQYYCFHEGFIIKITGQIEERGRDEIHREFLHCIGNSFKLDRFIL